MRVRGTITRLLGSYGFVAPDVGPPRSVMFRANEVQRTAYGALRVRQVVEFDLIRVRQDTGGEREQAIRVRPVAGERRQDGEASKATT